MLKLVDIVKDYRMADSVVHALRGINLNFRKSEFVSILGPSGCGKTTMLNIIGGLDKYTDGDLIINDRSTKEFRSRDWDAYRNRSIGFVFQSYNLIPHLNILQNVELALTISGVSRKKKKKQAAEALERVGLGNQLKKKPNQLSGGQMQRVAIARAIVNNPEIILADEPTGALDSKTSEQVMDLLQEISDDKLVIMVTHNPELARRYSTRIIELTDGEVISDNNPYDGLPTVLSPVGAVTDFDLSPIEAYIKEEEATPAPQPEKPAKKSKSKKGKKEDVIAAATATTEDAEADNPQTTAHDALALAADKHDAAVSVAGAPATDEQPSSDEKFVAVVTPDQPVKLKKRSGQPKEKKERTSMSFFTALSLSARNLIAKRTRTFLTAFAGSIGIIGIALVLSLSNGFNLYMDEMESSILSSMPLTINSMALDIDVDSLMNMEIESGDGEQFPDSDYVTPYAPSGVMGVEGINFGINVITDEYMAYVQEIPDKLPDTLNAIKYSYAIEMPLIVKNGNQYNVVSASSSILGDAMASMGMSTSPIGWQQLLWDGFMLDQFDIIAGGYPGTDAGNGQLREAMYEQTGSNDAYDSLANGSDASMNLKARQAVLVINSYNMIDYSILEALGLNLEKDADGNYAPINFNNILGTQITVISNDNYYDTSNAGWVDNGDGTRTFNRAEINEDYASYFDDEDNVKVTIVGVLRVKSGILTPLLQNGVAYTEDLTRLCLQKAANSDIVKLQAANSDRNILTGKQFSFDFSQIVSLVETFGMSESTVVTQLVNLLLEGDLSSLDGVFASVLESFRNGLTEEDQAALRACKTMSELWEKFKELSGISNLEGLIRTFLPRMDLEIPGTEIALSGQSILYLIDSAYQTVMQTLGGDDTPIGAYIYPTTFDAKDKICAYLDQWNKDNPTLSVTYTDYAGTISELLTKVVGIVSYILIAFAAISLVVSSVMIAIITYVSVLERTTEIGVLRSIGARKIDVSNVFNAETGIIGAVSGILGVFLAWIIDFPINYWISTLAPEAPENFAVLNPLHALLLVVLSIVLTMISGLVPAILAAKKDPVKALRASG